MSREADSHPHCGISGLALGPVVKTNLRRSLKDRGLIVRRGKGGQVPQPTPLTTNMRGPSRQIAVEHGLSLTAEFVVHQIFSMSSRHEKARSAAAAPLPVFTVNCVDVMVAGSTQRLFVPKATFGVMDKSDATGVR